MVLATELATEKVQPVPIESLPLYTAAEAFLNCRSAVVVAPHPDDETLGCGGAIALLTQRNIPVHILVISDGTQSHPNSKHYPHHILRQLRKAETQEAVRRLGIPPTQVTFLGYPDTAVPHLENELFEQAVETCHRYLEQRAPDLIFVPWKNDQHCDHQATWKIIHRSLQTGSKPTHQLAYAIWGTRAAGLKTLPIGETGWRLDIRSVQSLKHYAVTAHRSQTTDLISDDPSGFRLTPAMLNNLIQPWETYLENS